jgi:hypothetical protein
MMKKMDGPEFGTCYKEFCMVIVRVAVTLNNWPVLIQGSYAVWKLSHFKTLKSLEIRQS